MPKTTGAPRAISRAARVAAVAGFGFSGAAALVYEVAWTRELSVLFGSTVYAVSTMLAAFMAGLAIGSWVGGRYVDRDGARPLDLLAWLEYGIGAFGLLSLVLIRTVLPPLVFSIGRAAAGSPGAYFAAELLLSLLVMVVPTTLMGATLPVVSKIVVTGREVVGTEVGRVNAYNTFGSLAGSLAAGFLLIPLLGVRGAVLTAAALNLLVGTWVLVASGRERRLAAAGAAAVVFALLAAATGAEAGLGPSPMMMARFSGLAEYEAFMDGTRPAFDREGVYGRVTVLEVDGGAGAPGARWLRNGGFIEGSNQPVDIGTTGLLAAVPRAYAPEARSALVIGLGTGYTALRMLSYPIDRVDTVEINPDMDAASRYFVGDTLHDDPRWRLVVSDARTHVAASPGAYDIVTSEPSWPLATSSAQLFTADFFRGVDGSLREGGVFVQWVPGYLLTDRDLLVMYRTFAEVFPENTVWGMVDPAVPVGASDVFLVGFKGGAGATPAEASGFVEAYLADAGLEPGSAREMKNVAEIAASARAADVPINTDDRPVFEFSAARNSLAMLAAKK